MTPPEEPHDVDLGLNRAGRADQDQVEHAGRRREHDQHHERRGREQGGEHHRAQPAEHPGAEDAGHAQQVRRHVGQADVEHQERQPRPLPHERKAEDQPDPAGAEHDRATGQQGARHTSGGIGVEDQAEGHTGRQRRGDGGQAQHDQEQASCARPGVSGEPRQPETDAADHQREREPDGVVE